MKKVIFENGLRAFLATFCFLLLGAVAVSAQSKLTSIPQVPGVSNPPTPSSPIYEVPQGIFVSSAEAQSLLDAAMADMKDFMTGTGTNGPGDPLFEATLIKYKYYQSIKDHLWAGAATADAIAAGLWIFLQDADGLSEVSLSTQADLKAEAIDLLN
jgi:hypothetical protein